MWIQIKRVSSAELCETEESTPKFHTNEILLNVPYPSVCVKFIHIQQKLIKPPLCFKKKKNSMNMGPLQIHST